MHLPSAFPFTFIHVLSFTLITTANPLPNPNTNLPNSYPAHVEDLVTRSANQRFELQRRGNPDSLSSLLKSGLQTRRDLIKAQAADTITGASDTDVGSVVPVKARCWFCGTSKKEKRSGALAKRDQDDGDDLPFLDNSYGRAGRSGKKEKERRQSAGQTGQATEIAPSGAVVPVSSGDDDSPHGFPENSYGWAGRSGKKGKERRQSAGQTGQATEIAPSGAVVPVSSGDDDSPHGFPENSYGWAGRSGRKI